MPPQENDAKSFVENLAALLEDEDARYIYADTVANAFVASQIKALREQRGLSQEQLGQLIGTKQSGISRLQKSDYSAWKVETLRKLAKAFGVRLRISFEEFGTLIDDLGGFHESRLRPRKFEDDPVFQRDGSPVQEIASLPSGAAQRANPEMTKPPAMELGDLLDRGRTDGAYPSARDRVKAA